MERAKSRGIAWPDRVYDPISRRAQREGISLRWLCQAWGQAMLDDPNEWERWAALASTLRDNHRNQ